MPHWGLCYMTNKPPYPLRSDDDQPRRYHDPNEFRIPSKDAKGHGERVWVTFSTGALRQMAEIISSNRFPYKIIGDLIRHAVHRHLYFCLDLELLPSVMAEEEAIIRIIREQEDRARFESIIRSLSDTVSVLTADGANGQARQMLADVLWHVEKMPAGYWRNRWVEKIISNHGHLMDEGQAVSFAVLAVDELAELEGG